MKGRLAAAMALVALLATGGACQSSNLDANAAVTISGTVDRSAAGGRAVLVRQVGLGEAVTGLLEAGATAGLACLTTDPPAVCRNRTHYATIGSDGAYSFSIRGSDTQTDFGNAAGMLLAVDSGDGGSAAEEFRVQTATLHLPLLRFWHASARLQSAGRQVKVSWSPLPASGYGTRPGYTISLGAGAGDPIWQQSAQSGVALDQRILEDATGQAVVIATARGTAEGTTVSYSYTSGPLPFRGARVPSSRGAPCTVTAKGKPPGPPANCPFTNGDLTSPDRASQSGGPPEVVQLDLGQVRALDLLVLRGCPGCQVALSADGSAWQSLSEATADYALVPAGGRRARFVRVTANVSLLNLRQVSAW